MEALNLLDIAVWWLGLQIIGFVVLPVAAYIGRNLKDQGYSISKPLGLLLFTYITWMLSIFSNTSFSVLFAFGIIAVISLIVYWKNGLPFFQINHIIKFELLFTLAFLLFSLIRAYSPDIYWIGGEKFMDMTFINSFLRMQGFPPSDPWMSGVSMHYYYFGYLVVADLIRFTGILPSIAFNLATASFFALSLTTAFGIGYNLTGKTGSGLCTAFFVVIAGNLAGFFQMMNILFNWKGNLIENILSFNYWTSSRVIPNTINEFPFFSYLQGDVHAHMISITFQLLILLLLLNVLKSGIDSISLFILGLSIGFLYPLNTWDYPVYLFLTVSVIGFHFFISGYSSLSFKNKEFLKPISSITLVAGLSYILYLPYHLSNTIGRTVSFVQSGRTELVYYIAIYGLFLFLIYSFIIDRYKNFKQTKMIIFLVVLSIISVVLKFQLLILLIPLLIMAVISILKEHDINHFYVLILIITGALLSLFGELFYIQDALGSGNADYIRLNTIFKLYLQNWILWGISGGVILFQFSESFKKKKVLGIAVAVLILMVSVYPVFATIGKSGGFKGDPTLDGEAYVKKQHPQEYMAILWFRNITGQPVVLQAPGELYKWNTYITAFTGLPTVMGWAGHQLNWRFPSRKETDTRWSDTNKMYSSLNSEEVKTLLEKYNVTYIYFGEAEAKKNLNRRFYESHPELFTPVFEYGDVVVYKVRDN